ncbi:MAG: hypothetical protein OHK0040_09580 [bacterium]
MEMVKILKNKLFVDIVGVAGIVIVLSYQTGKLLEVALPKKKGNTIQQPTDILRGERAISHYATVVEQNPFGIKGAKFFVIEKAESKAPTLDHHTLVLKGVITLPPGYAFIENKDKVQKLFKKGEDVFGYGTLTMVEPKVVSLSQNGKVININLEGHEPEDKASSSPQKPTGNASAGQKERTFAKEEIKRFLEDPREILTDARLLPNFKDGKQEGFVVREVRPGGFYERIGLQNGDIILRANKIELTSPNDGIKIFSLIKELDRVELDILRDGRPMTQVYNIN